MDEPSGSTKSPEAILNAAKPRPRRGEAQEGPSNPSLLSARVTHLPRLNQQQPIRAYKNRGEMCCWLRPSLPGLDAKTAGIPLPCDPASPCGIPVTGAKY